MAFKRKFKQKESVELVSMIDMIFILLVFFLVTSFVIRTPFQERGMYVPTPENSLGRAQIVIQFIDADRFFWLDESASAIVTDIENNFGYLSPSRLRDKMISELLNQNIFSFNQLEEKLTQLRRQADQNPFTKFFVLIRCPNEIPYFYIIQVMARLSDTSYRNIKYGCVGGTLHQIRQCRRIYTAYDTDAQGNRRRNIRIDF